MFTRFDYLFLLFATLSFGISHGQTLSSEKIPEPFSRWDDEIIQTANTAESVSYMDEEEKMVILYTNLARLDGPLFAETFLVNYIEIKKIKSNKYTRSLYKDLEKIKDLAVLMPEKDLYNIARDHAIKSGKKGYEGHKGFKTRFKPVMNKYSQVGENLYYGDYTPVEIVIQLLIDKDISDLGHRLNMLDPDFNSVGVAIKPHKKYKYNCAMEFGRVVRSYKDHITN